jgi:hypothetical protein
MGMGMGMGLFFGLCYDIKGPRWVSVTGAVVASVGLVGMAAALSHHSLNWLLFVFYPLATCGAMCTGYSFFGFLWFFPESPNLINSLNLGIATFSRWPKGGRVRGHLSMLMTVSRYHIGAHGFGLRDTLSARPS